MAGLPVTLKLELDDSTNSGTWPTDITSRLDLRAGVNLQRGRTDIFTDTQPAELGCRLKNNDGALSRGGSLGTFKDQRIRLSATKGGTTYRRFTGYVRGWPNAWEGGPGKKSFVDVRAFDQFPRLSRQPMSNQVRQEIVKLTPRLYYPMDEPSTALTASPAVAGTPPLNHGRPNSTPVTFGVATPGLGVDPVSQVSVGFAGGDCLLASFAPITGASAVSLSCAYLGTTPGASIVELITDNYQTIRIGVDGTGHAYAQIMLSYSDGLFEL